MHMHVGCVLVFEGLAPSLAELTEHVRSRLDLVPRYRRRAVAVPLRQGRPVWVDDPHLALGYHVRDIALAGAADDAALGRLAGRGVLPAASITASRCGRCGSSSASPAGASP